MKHKQPQSPHHGFDFWTLSLVLNADQNKKADMATADELEEQDITIYCAGYYEKALFIMLFEGLALRLATLFALYFCPRGLSFEPVVIALGAVVKRIRRLFRKKQAVNRRSTAATNRK